MSYFSFSGGFVTQWGHDYAWNRSLPWGTLHDSGYIGMCGPNVIWLQSRAMDCSLTRFKQLAIICLPLASSLYQACTIALACFLWWMSHSESVWTLCCVLERSDNFFSSVAVEKDVIFIHKIETITTKTEKTVVNQVKSNCERKTWAWDSLDFGKKPLRPSNAVFYSPDS